jgi:hypothetical protein
MGSSQIVLRASKQSCPHKLLSILLHLAKTAQADLKELHSFLGGQYSRNPATWGSKDRIASLGRGKGWQIMFLKTLVQTVFLFLGVSILLSYSLPYSSFSLQSVMCCMAVVELFVKLHAAKQWHHKKTVDRCMYVSK